MSTPEFQTSEELLSRHEQARARFGIGTAKQSIPTAKEDGGSQMNTQDQRKEARKPMNNIPRRNRLDQHTPAETAIREALLAVEAVGADPKLTEAVILLGKAKDLVADYVDASLIPPEPKKEVVETTDREVRDWQPNPNFNPNDRSHIPNRLWVHVVDVMTSCPFSAGETVTVAIIPPGHPTYTELKEQLERAKGLLRRCEQNVPGSNIDARNWLKEVEGNV